MLSAHYDDAHVEETTNSGAMGFPSMRLHSNRGWLAKGFGGRRAGRIETWRAAIGPELRNTGEKTNRQKGARNK
jgi:hypothetical protein